MRRLVFLSVLALTGVANAATAAEARLEQVSIYPGEFTPDPLVVKLGDPLKLLVTTRVREHVNRLAFFRGSPNLRGCPPGKTTVVEFTPDEIWRFRDSQHRTRVHSILRVVE